MKKAILYHDTLDDKREMHALLDRLTPRRRLQWLHYCCQHCALNGSDKHPHVDPAHTGNAMECFFDAWLLVQYYNLDLQAALSRLVDLAKGKPLE